MNPPEGLPPLPPVPDGYDRWEYRGLGWWGVKTTEYAVAKEGDKTWRQYRSTPAGATYTHYLEAVRAEPESSPTPETDAIAEEYASTPHECIRENKVWLHARRLERERDALKAENGRLRAALELGREVMRQLSALANVNEATRGILRSTGEKFAKALAGKDAP